MASAVQICNRALIKLGADTIISMTEDSKPARLCNILYTPLREELLRLHPWNFAIARADLAQSTSDPLFGFDFSYPLPVDCLRVLKLDDTTIKYKIEGRSILTDSDEVLLIYIKNETDTTKFDSLFTSALVLKLAIELSYNITGASNVAAGILDEYKNFMREAKLRDGQEGTPDQLENYTWLDSR